jgi:hypothetical protein
MLKLLKTLHTVIWVIMTSSNFLAFYFAYIGRFDAWFWVPFCLIAFECVVIVINGWHCPITPFAAKYTQDRKPNFDIYLPEWLAKYNVRIFGALIALEILIVLAKRFF